MLWRNLTHGVLVAAVAAAGCGMNGSVRSYPDSYPGPSRRKWPLRRRSPERGGTPASPGRGMGLQEGGQRQPQRR